MKKITILMLLVCIFLFPVTVSAGTNVKKAYNKAVTAVDKAYERLYNAEMKREYCEAAYDMLVQERNDYDYELAHFSSAPVSKVKEIKDKISKLEVKIAEAQKEIAKADKLICKRTKQLEKALYKYKKLKRKYLEKYGAVTEFVGIR